MTGEELPFQRLAFLFLFSEKHNMESTGADNHFHD